MQITTLQSGKDGPNVLVLGSIHGNERSGSVAIERFIETVHSQVIGIIQGSITLIANCNEEAGKQYVRYVEENLNRCFFEGQNSPSYEGGLGRELMKEFERKDYLLDLHSTSGPSIPFLFSEKENMEMAKKIGVPHVIVGWGELGSDSIDGTTENYMNSLGGQGFTFEAGNHESPEGGENAYQVLLNFLSSLGIIDQKLYKELPGKKTFIHMSHIHVCKTGVFKFVLSEEELVNFTPLKKGTLIGIDGEEEIRAEKDCILVMPSLNAVKKGEDVFFLGEILEE